ncbi:hypothetical protein ACFWAX_25510, partial [Streptomyces sp. NPDC059956]|uniref:hypothetical protein n=1 Tax=Streptomyces sp. NPDC059956 TaxID=3347015 RepID=UPI00364F48D7
AVALALASGVPASPAGATTPMRFQHIACESLSGTGSYADPLRIGPVSTPLWVFGCPPLRSGVGYNVRYFSFEYLQPPLEGSFVATVYAPSGTGPTGVHPRLSSGAVTVKQSLDAEFIRLGDREGFAHATAGLHAGTWRLGAEKLSSPLAALATEAFDVVIVP